MVTKSQVAIGIRLPVELAERLRVAANRERRTISNYVALAVEEKLERERG